MKVSLAPSPSFMPVKAPGTASEGRPLLDENGPRTVLSWNEGDFAVSVRPDRSTFFGPRGVCLHPNGSFWVSDTGHHRLLGWHQTPIGDNAPADILIGQPSFSHEGRNAKAEPNGASLNVPTGFCAMGDGLAVADAWNHRVLIWRDIPSDQNQPADIVLGQRDFNSVLANHGQDKPSASTLHWPYGVAYLDGKLIVCDTGNRRLLIWDEISENGQPADLVLGQRDFGSRDENAGGGVSAMSMRWPHQITLWQGHLAVADAGNNRVMLWDGVPDQNGKPCDAVIGQANFEDCDHNCASYYPSNRAVNMPYALASIDDQLIVGDTANSRLIGWFDPETGAVAKTLTGQPDFAAKGDNRWGVATRDSLCWPYGLSIRENLVAIADSGNNRVLLWEIAS